MAMISTKGAYGLTAMTILAQEENQGLLHIKEIATKGNIPKNYLEQILVLLKRSGLVKSTRGANGGYQLAKPIHNISVFEILNSLESCITQSEHTQEESILEPFWEHTQAQVQGIFSLSLGELLEFLEKDSRDMIYYV